MGPRVSHRSGLGLIADESCKATAGVALFPADKEKKMKQAHRDEEARNLHSPYRQRPALLVPPPEQPLGEGIRVRLLLQVFLFWF